MLDGILQGWPIVLANLKFYLETGTPFANDLSQMQNATELTATEN